MTTYKEFIDSILETRGRFACGDEYHERHHITPKCIGGTNNEENLIDLFAREHFEAHRLLALENPENEKLIFAWNMMSHCHKKNNQRYQLTPEEYEEARKAFAKSISQLHKKRNEIKRQKNIENKCPQMILLPEARKETKVLFKVNRTVSVETKKKLSERKTGAKNHQARKILQYDLDGNYIKEWSCIQAAADELVIHRNMINRCCQKDELYKQAGGFIWRYVDEPLTIQEIEEIKIRSRRIPGIYETASGKWRSYAKSKYLGMFKTKEEAIEAKFKAIKEIEKKEPIQNEINSLGTDPQCSHL